MPALDGLDWGCTKAVPQFWSQPGCIPYVFLSNQPQPGMQFMSTRCLASVSHLDQRLNRNLPVSFLLQINITFLLPYRLTIHLWLPMVRRYSSSWYHTSRKVPIKSSQIGSSPEVGLKIKRIVETCWNYLYYLAMIPRSSTSTPNLKQGSNNSSWQTRCYRAVDLCDVLPLAWKRPETGRK